MEVPHRLLHLCSTYICRFHPCIGKSVISQVCNMAWHFTALRLSSAANGIMRASFTWQNSCCVHVQAFSLQSSSMRWNDQPPGVPFFALVMLVFLPCG